METFYFVFGVLSVVCLIFMTLIILGTVKIKKLSNSIENNQKDLDNLYREVDQRERTIRRILEDHSRDVTMVERTLFSKIERDCGDTRSYVDSRIDKSLSNISKDK
jgi:predicted Holliday junction resolvase-like endonuclease